MTRFIERLLNLQRGDLRRGILLCSYLFLIITAYLIGKNARDTLFLSKFRPEQLPYVDIAIAVLVGFVVAGYVWVARRVNLRSLLLGSTLFFAAVMLLFWRLQGQVRPGWLYPAFYIWVGIFGVLAPTQVWTVANYLLTTREAKRLYGLVGAGATLGNVSAGVLTKAISKSKAGPESLALAMALTLIACLFVIVPLRPGTTAAGGAPPGEKQPAGGATRLRLAESLRLIWSWPYLRTVAALIWIASFVTALAGWQFKTISQSFYLNPLGQLDTKAYAAFRGSFDLYTGILCLLVQVLLTSKVLKRFGIGPALLVVPITVLLGSDAILLWGTLASVVFLAGSDKTLRYSIDRSTAELLYLPVPANVKVPLKSFIDTVIWRLGDGLQGVAVLLFVGMIGEAATPLWKARCLSYLTLLMALGWMGVALAARRRYVATLTESVRQHRLDAEQISAPVLDRATTDIFAAYLSSADAKELLYALSLFEIGHQGATHPAVRVLLNHPSAQVRRKAIAISAAAGDKTVLPLVEKLLRDPHVEVRTEALLYLARQAGIDPLARLHELGDFPDFSVRAGVVWYLAQPGPTQSLETVGIMLEAMLHEKGPEGQRTRAEAARLIGELGEPFDEKLEALLADGDVEIARQAIRAAGKLRERRCVPLLLNRLADPQVAAEAGQALAEFGEPIAGALGDYLADSAAPLAARREAPALLASIGTQASAEVLAGSLLEPDTTLRFRVLSALNKLRRDHPEVLLDKEMIETMLAAEIMGHYRSYQILGALGGAPEDEAAVSRLRESMESEVERIFRLLGLLLPHHDFHSTYVGLQSSNAVVHDNALELLDNILQPQLRNLLVPLVDGAVSAAERSARANRLIGAKIEKREQAVAAMLAGDDPWLKSCGCYAAGSFGLTEMEPYLDACLEHPDPQVREAARLAKLRLAARAQAPGA
jgi:AAA family ATP:ADP antiporter